MIHNPGPRKREKMLLRTLHILMYLDRRRLAKIKHYEPDNLNRIGFYEGRLNAFQEVCERIQGLWS